MQIERSDRFENRQFEMRKADRIKPPPASLKTNPFGGGESKTEMTTDTDETQNRLIAEQLGHTLDLIKSELAGTRAEQEHSAAMNALRLEALEVQASDFEKRLRELTESATQFKLLVSLAVGGGMLSLIELVRSLLRP
jgi:hypothetical protein